MPMASMLLLLLPAATLGGGTVGVAAHSCTGDESCPDPVTDLAGDDVPLVQLTSKKALSRAKVESALKKEYLQEWAEAKKFLAQNNFTSEARPVRGKLDPKMGLADHLITFGAPGSGSPGLKSVIDGSCFTGTRVWTYKDGKSDPVPQVTNANYFWHPTMDALRMDVGDSTQDVRYSCPKDNVAKLPPWQYTGKWNWDLHRETSYVPAIQNSPLLETKVYDSLFKLSYVKNHEKSKDLLQEIVDNLKSMSWSIVGFASYKGDLLTGEQVSYLVQDEKDLGCVLTFQGTDSAQDGWTDLAAYAVPFCGLTQRGDTCCTYDPVACVGQCSPKGNGISFVHQGFRNQLQRMVSDGTWQKNIREQLPYCKSVQVLGHSLGGALSELFTSCLEQNLQPGDFGYEDFSVMTWSRKEPKKLEPMVTNDLKARLT